MTPSELGRQLGVSSQVIYWRARRLGYEKPAGSHWQLTDAQIKAVAEYPNRREKDRRRVDPQDIAHIKEQLDRVEAIVSTLAADVVQLRAQTTKRG